MNRNFFICSAGDENKDFGDKNLENCINNKAHIMHRGTAQKGVFNSIKPKDILFLKYNGRLVAYGLSTGREDSEKQDSDGWDFYSYVEEWFFHDNKNPRNGVSNEGVSKYIKEGSGQYGTVKEIELPYAIRKMEEIDNQSLLFKKIKEEVSMSNFKLQILELLDKNKNLILTGAPGAGKTYLAKELAKLITQAEENSSQIASVQFHPSYDYSDFIEGLKPKISNGQMEFEPKAGVFKSFCEDAGKPENKDKKYAFIIDEINRADLSRVFGEAFSLLEESYRGEFIETQYSYITGNKFTIPENVYIIGTMNDVDRSVESMDFALRRRFAWREISAKDSESIIDVADIDQQWKVEAKKRMSSLNDKIAEILESTSYQIGGAYYKKLEKYKASNDLTEAFKQLWNNHIAVLLHEYLRGIPKSKDKFEEMKKAFDA